MRNVAVIGLGYVGLPLAVAFAQKHAVVCFDKNEKRIEDLKNRMDKNLEVSKSDLENKNLKFTANENDLQSCDFYIVAVPTPVNDAKQPDLTPLISASEVVGRHLKKNDIVVYESTVYPGATEEDCAPILEKFSKLKCGIDFKLGYSPERINPGDSAHVLRNTVKIVSGQDEETLNIIAGLYGSVVEAGVYRAESIKIAEAAKVIENTQRDVNISLMNELALILNRMNIDTESVLRAASTKWNFLPFKPGLVGGHCIGVDPYYIAYKAQTLGYYPDVILSGRRVNDLMGQYVAEVTIKNLIQLGVTIKNCRVAVLGITFKENCVDTRNSRVFDLIDALKDYGVDVLVHDPVAPEHVVSEEHVLDICPWDKIINMDAIVLCVAHQFYVDCGSKVFKEKLKSPGLIMDIKHVLDPDDFNNKNIMLWRL